jgi:hypothetical protein
MFEGGATLELILCANFIALLRLRGQRWSKRINFRCGCWAPDRAAGSHPPLEGEA